MDQQAIKQGLKQRGFSLSLLAEALGRSPSLVSKVVSRQAKSLEVAKAIAKVLQKPISEVFPDIPEYEKPMVPSKRDKSEYQESLDRLKSILSEGD